jgi:hypothetical protein
MKAYTTAASWSIGFCEGPLLTREFNGFCLYVGFNEENLLVQRILHTVGTAIIMKVIRKRTIKITTDRKITS